MKWINEVKGSGYYDCIIGLSGGVDSSYLAHLAVNVWGLKCLAYTFDNGWSDPIADENIKALVKKLKLDHIVEKHDVNKYNKAMILSGFPDVDIPSDLALLRRTFDLMYENDIKYYLSGANSHTEIPIPLKWSLIDDAFMMDVVERTHETVPIIPRLTAEFYLQHVQDHIEIRPLGMKEVPDDEVIKDFLEKEYGWKRYGGKHCENLYTKWCIYHHLPLMFGIEKWKNYKGYGKEKIIETEIVNTIKLLDINIKDYIELETKINRKGYANNLSFWKSHKRQLKGKVPESFWSKYV